MHKRYPIYVEIGLILSLVVLIVAFRVPLQQESDFQAVTQEQETVELEEIQQTQQEQEPPPPPRPPVPVEVPNDAELEDTDLNLDASLDLEETLEPSPPPPEPEDEGEEEEEDEVFMVVEEMPEPKGGMAALQQKIEYPEFARKAGIEGRVFVQFTVDENGQVTNPVVQRGVHKLLDQEAVRVVQETEFVPGRQRGNPVKVRMSLPITFKLQ